jgi:hypothetical protein
VKSDGLASSLSHIQVTVILYKPLYLYNDLYEVFKLHASRPNVLLVGLLSYVIANIASVKSLCSPVEVSI